MRLTRTGIGIAAGCLAALAALGGAIVASLVIDGAPPDVAPSERLVVPVSTAEFEGSRNVPLLVTLSEQGPLRSNVAGTVTATACEPGAVLASGDVLGAVDALPVRLLSTTVPLWRDLRAGDRGEDVSALQTELTRLGFEVASSGRVDGATAAAVRAWLSGGDGQLWRAYQRGDSSLVLPLAAVVWSPQRSVIAVSCDLRLGDSVAVGDTVLTPAPEVQEVALANPVPEMPGRSWTLTLGDATVVVDPAGTVTNPDDLAALAATDEFAAWLRSDRQERQLMGTLALDRPVTVGVVPPAALVGLATSQPCLIDPDGNVTPVLVVSSRLGQSLVVPQRAGATLPQQVVVDRTGGGTCVSR
jgi:hypothetical protein